MKRRLFLTTLIMGGLALSGCHTAMIKPEDKVIKASYEFSMPDYEETKQSVIEKTQKWLEQDDRLTHLYTKNDTVYGMATLQVHTHGDYLKTKFELELKVLDANHVEMTASKFEDLNSPRKGYLSRAYVFKHKVIPAVEELGEDYEDYMDSDTKVETILDQQ